MKVFFRTLGCKVNQYETEAMEEIFLKKGYEISKDENEADIAVINTCSVTHLAESKSRKFIRQAKRNNPDCVVCVVGCYPQVASDEIKKIAEADIILGTGSKGKIVELTEEFMANRKKKADISEISEDFEPLFVTNTDDKTRAVMKIQDGCNQFCSYCIIPYARGRIRSRDLNDILKEANVLKAKGFKEIVLTGIHVASFGKDFNEDISLIDVVEKISEIEGIERIRLSSLEQSVITEDFLRRVKDNGKFCDHFHLSLQSGSNSVLKRMNRHYTREDYLDKVNMIREVFPYAGITTDIIVGFPGETDEEFKETCDFAKLVGFSKIHIFPYSVRKGTPAAKMVQVEDFLKKERAKELALIEEDLRNDFLNRFIGRKVEILTEKEIKKNIWQGHTSNYLMGVFKSEENFHNIFANIKVEKCVNNKLWGMLIEK